MVLIVRSILLIFFFYFSFTISNQALCQSRNLVPEKGRNLAPEKGINLFSSRTAKKYLFLFAESGYSAACNSSKWCYSGYNLGATTLLKVFSMNKMSVVVGGGVNYEFFSYKYTNTTNDIVTHFSSTYDDITDTTTQTDANFSALYFLGQAGVRFRFKPDWSLFVLGSAGASLDSSQTIKTVTTYNYTFGELGDLVRNEQSTKKYTKTNQSRKTGGLIRTLFRATQEIDLGFEAGLYAINVGTTYYNNININIVASYGFY